MIILLLFLVSSIEADYHHHIPSNTTERYNRPLTISTLFGKIQGSILTTRLNKEIFAFRGIKYASAPRFEPSVLIDHWDNVYNATEDGPVCPQPGFDDPMEEDCLYLNVYTTKIPTSSNKPKRPVIIHLHAGGFYAVTGRSNLAGPQYFMDQDIVLVTLNYRIGSLGFLSVGREVPGNNGLKDQVQALKWVKKNIEYFGGDPNSVTLFGYSAGAWSITLHMVSPMSTGLFHKAILGSGSSLGHFPLPNKQLEVARRQARAVRCPDDSPSNIVSCLRNIPAETLGNSFRQMQEFGIDPILIWTPVIEEDFGQERFLTENPVKMYSEGRFAQIPVITGVTTDEIGNRAFNMLLNSTLVDQLKSDFERYGPIAFIYEKNTEKSREVSRAVQDFYLGAGLSMEGIMKLYADSVIGFPVYRTVKLIAEKNTKPVYYSLFSYQGRYSHYYLPGTNNTVPIGVMHHDDLIYLFYISLVFPYFTASDPESLMVDKLSTLYYNFAKTGNPTPHKTSKLDNVIWEEYDCHQEKYLDISKKLVMREKLYSDRYKFWEKLYPIPKF